MAQLICDNLSIGYEGKIIAKNISFRVDKGDYLCIAGANGSGKSTLIKTLLRLQPPLNGSITLGDGMEFGSIGYLPQQTAVQRDFPACVSEIVMSGFVGYKFRPFYGRDKKALAEQNMKRMGIYEFAGKSYRRLSGGQQQRVLLARALCAASKMLLLDEPVSGLDPQAASDMYNLVYELNRDGMTVIMVSHDLTAVTKYPSHVLVLDDTPFFGTRDEYVNHFFSVGKESD